MRRRRSPIAIDFGEHSVAALQLETRSGRVRVVAAAWERLAAGEPATREQRWLVAAAAALRRARCRGGQAVVALGLDEVKTPHVRVPADELDKAGERIAAHVATHATDAGEVTIAPLGVADLYDQGAAKREFLCCVAGVDAIQRRIALVERLRLRPVAIEFAPLARLRPLLRGDGSDSFVHVDFGALETRVTVVRAGDPVLVRGVRVGGDQVQQAVEARLGLPLATIDELAGEAADAAALAEAVAAAVGTPLAPVVRKVAEGIRYCGSLFHGRAVTALRATGALAHLPGLVAWLGRAVGVSSEIAEPFVSVEPGPLAGRPPVERGRYATALGLALGSAAA